MKQKQVIILLGPPGSGKGTQGILLAEKLGLYYFETSRILEDSFKSHKPDEFFEVDGKKYSFGAELKLWKTGVLCSPVFVFQLVSERIKELHQQGEGLLLSGSPRTLPEGQKLMPILEELYGKENIKVIFMEIPPKETIFRNSHRRICQLMRHPILYSKETEKLTKCPIDGSKLVRRKGLDDNIQTRIEEFQNRTMPLIEFLEKQGFAINKVDGQGSVAVVFERNLKAIS